MSRSRRRPIVPAPARGAVALLAVLLAGCGSSSPGAAPPEPGAAPAGTAVVGEVDFGVVGDSITAGLDGPVEGTRVVGRSSWVPAADAAPLDFRGGWAVPGATTADMRAGVRAVDADVLVVMAGTNDVLRGVPWSESRENLLAIVATAGVADVVLAAVPPSDLTPDGTASYRARLAELAAEQDWRWVDPWAGETTPAGSWAPGTSDDGIHPRDEVADRIGELLRAELLGIPATVVPYATPASTLGAGPR